MAWVLATYGTRSGQTRRIASRIADRLRSAGHRVDVYDAGFPPAPERLARYDGVIIGSAVRGGQHTRAVRQFVRAHRTLLERVPAAFFSVSLLQMSRRQASRRRAAEYLPDFFEQTGWHPELATVFAGAMRYTQWGWLGRRVMRAMWRRDGIDQDVSRDHEYTDWQAVDRFAEAFSRRLPARAGAVSHVRVNGS